MKKILLSLIFIFTLNVNTSQAQEQEEEVYPVYVSPMKTTYFMGFRKHTWLVIYTDGTREYNDSGWYWY